MKLTVTKIQKTYKDKIALKNVSFTLEPGVYGLLGPNGAGKTTLLKIMANILSPTSGSVLLDGVSVGELEEKYREQLGYMPQNLGIYRSFTAEQYLLYIAALKGLDEKRASDIVRQHLDMVGLSHVNKKKLGSFSGGMLRRIGIAQTLLNDPKILLLDEPTAGLDPQERIRLRNILSKLSEECIVIVSTHIVSDIELIADKVMLLKDGELLALDSVGELTKGLDGVVWSADLTQEEISDLPPTCIIGNMVQGDGVIKVRLIAPMQPHKKAVSISPSLEDLYLYHFGGRDQLEAVN